MLKDSYNQFEDLIKRYGTQHSTPLMKELAHRSVEQCRKSRIDLRSYGSLIIDKGTKVIYCKWIYKLWFIEWKNGLLNSTENQ